MIELILNCFYLHRYGYIYALAYTHTHIIYLFISVLIISMSSLCEKRIIAIFLQPSRFFRPESWNEFTTVADSMDFEGIGSKQWLGARYNETAREVRDPGTLHWVDGSGEIFLVYLYILYMNSD